MLAISSCSLACALWRSASFAYTPATIHQPADNEHGSTAGKAHTSGLLRLVLVSRKLFHDVLGIWVVGDEELVVVAIEQVGILERELDLGQVGSVDGHLRLFAKSVSDDLAQRRQETLGEDSQARGDPAYGTCSSRRRARPRSLSLRLELP